MTELSETNDRNNCAVRALSVALGIPYPEIASVFLSYGRRPHCRTSWKTISEVMEHYGHKLQSVRGLVTSRTVRTVVRELSSGIYVINTSRHLLTVKNGKVYDWTEDRTHRIIDIYVVMKVSEVSGSSYSYGKSGKYDL